MNSLVDYASDSEDSEEEPYIKAVPTASTSVSPTLLKSNTQTLLVQPHANEQLASCAGPSLANNDTEEIQINAALKELQSFAASVDENAPTVSEQELESKVPLPDLQAHSDNKPASDDDDDNNNNNNGDGDNDNEIREQLTKSSDRSPEVVPPPAPPPPPQPAPPTLTPEQESIFNAFLDRITAIPFTSVPQLLPPAFPKKPESTHDRAAFELAWQRTQTVQSIYSRIHRLSTLVESSPAFDHEELESRLIEFAIRILDWEQGGLSSVYFLGVERALYDQDVQRRKKQKENNDKDDDEAREEELEDEKDVIEYRVPSPTPPPPPYGGVVGETLQQLYELENTAAPLHWKLVWDPKEEAYFFHHIASGIISENYPAHDILERLDPKSSGSQAAAQKKRSSLSASTEPAQSIPDIKRRRIASSDSE
ncbi:hypothetical protein BG004_002721 [Podila humilis]|nr:hypothetical protein BG004_002721 [Podila humilis]